MSFNPPLRPGNLIKGFKADGRESSAPSRLSEEDEARALLLRGARPRMTHWPRRCIYMRVETLYNKVLFVNIS